jgi:hypothetical protein
MAKKVYDVKPPKVAKKTAARTTSRATTSRRVTRKEAAPAVTAKPVEAVVEERPAATHHTHHKKQRKPIWMTVSVGVLAVALIVGVYLFFALPKATIAIWPKVETMSYNQAIVADKSVNSVNAEEKTIPAKYFEVSKTFDQDFPATGNASDEGRASGTITVFNKYDPVAPLTLKAGTHFMSDSGKLFKASQKIVVPAAKKSGSKITPGSVQVVVEAVEGGDSYNISPANFSVPGLKGTAWYYSIYATSQKAMSGGYAGKTKKVTDDDLQLAKDAVVKEATSKAMDDLKGQIPSDYILVDGAASSITTESSSPAKTGTVTENFNYKATVKVSALVFKKSDAESFAKSYILSQIPVGQTLLDSSFKLDYSAGPVDISGGKETVNLIFSAGAYQGIDTNAVSLSLMGKNEKQIDDFITNSMGGQITNKKINFWPFWVKAAPTSQKAVNVKLMFE